MAYGVRERGTLLLSNKYAVLVLQNFFIRGRRQGNNKLDRLLRKILCLAEYLRVKHVPTNTVEQCKVLHAGGVG